MSDLKKKDCVLLLVTISNTSSIKNSININMEIATLYHEDDENGGDSTNATLSGLLLSLKSCSKK